jgi:hypothetical protein
MNSKQPDIKAFEKDIDEAILRLTGVVYFSFRQSVPDQEEPRGWHYRESSPEGPKSIEDLQQIEVRTDDPEVVDAVTQVATNIKNKKIRKRICAALGTVTQDMFDLSKILIPVLIPLSLAQKIPLSPNPLVLGAVILLISKMGIAAFCADVQDQKTEPQNRKGQ